MEVQQRRDKEQLGDTSSLSSSLASTASCFFPCELDEPKPSHGDTADSKASQPEQAKAATKDGRTASARPEWARRPLPVGTADQLFNPERYLLWHKRALLQRMRVGYGRSHEMIRLYNFWVSFLQDAFNEPMYTKFKTYAEEDASAGYTYGLTCLFSFYRRYLTARFEAEIYQDFEALALKYQDYLNYMEGMDCLFAFLTTGSTGCSSSSSMPQTLPVHVQHGWPAAAGGTHPAAAGSNWPADSSHAPMPAAAPGTEGHAVMLGEPQEPACGVAVVQQQPRRHAASMRSSLDETSSASASCSDGAPTSTAAAPSQTSTSPAPCFPGLPRDAGITVDPRVVEQFQLWHASQACTWAPQGGGSSGGQRCIDPDDGSSDIMHTGGSLTGSSEAGDAAGTEGEGRPMGRKAQRQQGARAHRGSWSACGGPPAPFGPYAMGYGASPSGLVSGFACSLPVASTLAAAYPLLPDTSPGRHMSVGSTPSGGFSSGFKVGSAPGVPPLAGATPSGTRAKRPRHKPGNFKRCTSFLPGSSPSVAPVLGSSPPLRSHASAPYGQHASTSTRACGARVGKAAWSSNATKGSQVRAGGAAPRAAGVPASQGHKHVGAEPGAGQDAGPPLWEAQPCVAACGASAELIRALPMRLGELFGD